MNSDDSDDGEHERECARDADDEERERLAEEVGPDCDDEPLLDLYDFPRFATVEQIARGAGVSLDTATQMLPWLERFGHTCPRTTQDEDGEVVHLWLRLDADCRGSRCHQIGPAPDPVTLLADGLCRMLDASDNRRLAVEAALDSGERHFVIELTLDILDEVERSGFVITRMR